MSNKRIAALADCHTKTVRNLRKRMDYEPVSELMVIAKGSGRKPKANAEIKTQIIEKVKAGTFLPLADCRHDKDKLCPDDFGVCCLEAFERVQYLSLKSGSLPLKADVEEQRKFYDNTLHPLMEKAKSGECVLLFGDASHFVMGCDFLGSFYGLFRKFMKTLSGRKRYNVLGMLNFATKVVHTVTNDTYITATEVCKMLIILEEYYRGRTITLILDNARYQKCKAVMNLAKQLNIELIFIPPYSPNLNLIERFWKFVKAELRTKFYDDFSEFCAAIDGIIASSVGENRARVETLIGEKVQLFDNLQQVSEHFFEQRRKSNEEKAA
ncbi:MAG: IS630 family transposase [Desulfovibrionaceae bacterium]|nr:IS630 family transposase [Desulfovibrionaceae bacterium]